VNRPRPQPPSGKTAQAGRARPSRGFRPESAFGFVTISDGALLAGMIGQALAHAAGQAAIFAPFVHGELHGTMFVIPTFMIGAALGQSYAYVSQQVTLWLPLVRMVLLAHLPLLALGLLDLAVFPHGAVNFLFLSGPMALLSTALLPYIWRGARRHATDTVPSPEERARSPRDREAILAWPLCAVIVWLALVPMLAIRTATSIDDFAMLVTIGAWSVLVLPVLVVPIYQIRQRRLRPRLNAVLFSVTGAAQLGLTAFYGAMALRVSALGYTFGATAALMPVIHVIALVLLATSPFAILLLRAARPGYRTLPP
jgi:hypothetical protein